jgi:preprotein translocase subunit YajC
VFISNAWAQAAATPDAASTFTGMLPLLLMFAVLYFLMIRPQIKRAKEQKLMIEALQKGDEVVTQGGVVGTVKKVSDTYVVIEVAANVDIAVQKQAVGAQLPKGTIKTI